MFHLQGLDMKCDFIPHIQPMKMQQIECPEMSADNNQRPGKYPKKYIQVFSECFFVFLSAVSTTAPCSLIYVTDAI